MASLSHETENQGPGSARVMHGSLANQSRGGAYGASLRAQLGPQPLPQAASSFSQPWDPQVNFIPPISRGSGYSCSEGGPCPGHGTPSTSPTAFRGVPTNQAQVTARDLLSERGCHEQFFRDEIIPLPVPRQATFCGPYS